MRRIKEIVFTLSLLLFVSHCNKNPVDDGDGITYGPPVYPEIDQSPAWSPDGSIIAYYHNGTTKVHQWGAYDVNPDSVGLYFISPSGDNKRQFLKGENRMPAFSPDGEWIAFVNGTQIYKIKTNGDSLTQLTLEGRNFFPAWSPDGRWIAYDNTNCGSAIKPAPPNACGVLIVESCTSEKKFIIRGRMPDWLPGGKHLVYIGLHSEVYRVNVNDTTEIVRLTSLNQVDSYATDNRYPKYSPDGTKIAFCSKPRVGPPAIWVMNSDGLNLRKVSPDYAWWFDWSPDGSQLVFLYWDFLTERPGNGQLWLVNVDGSGLRQLTHFKDNSS